MEGAALPKATKLASKTLMKTVGVAKLHVINKKNNKKICKNDGVITADGLLGPLMKESSQVKSCLTFLNVWSAALLCSVCVLGGNEASSPKESLFFTNPSFIQETTKHFLLYAVEFSEDLEIREAHKAHG